MPLFRYASTYDQEKTRFLKEATRHLLPPKESLKSAAWPAREVPLALKSLDMINLTLMNRLAGATCEGVNIGDYLLAHKLDSGVILLGTKYLAKKFAVPCIREAISFFFRYGFPKSINATLNICPQMYFQVLLLMEQVMNKNMIIKKLLWSQQEPMFFCFFIKVFGKYPKMVICFDLTFNEIFISNFFFIHFKCKWIKINITFLNLAGQFG